LQDAPPAREDCERPNARRDRTLPIESENGRLRKAPRTVLLGYARVSTVDDQSTTAQARALRDAGCERVFEEVASGGRWDRPELQRLLDHLRPGDTLVVWKLDRLSRSLKDALTVMERVEAAGAGFRSLTEAVDTTSPAGRMMAHMLGAFAEFERSMIRERTAAGLRQARAEGRVGGRRRKLSTAQRREIVESVVSGRRTAADMARLYGVSQPTVSRIVADARAGRMDA
jgi:DNA invertase Pin-like site-specific DNA recombinase